MLIEKIKTPGLAQLSYFIASGNQACVIDPRRDVDCYMELAHQHGCSITHIFETHRNEDLVSGSPILAKKTRARILHGERPGPNVEFAEAITDGDCFVIGQCEVQALATPGHTKDSISYLLFDPEFNNSPVGVFTGDTLFVGDVGRTDFYPDEMREMASALFESLQKLKSVAGNAIIYPAHGAGSVCGDNMANREFSTVAHEFENNSALADLSREQFIDKKVKEQHEQPPYFRHMEALNFKGTESWPEQRPYLNWDSIRKQQEQKGAILIDVRPPEAYIAGHVPGAICLPADMITAYAGWLLHWEDEFILIGGSKEECELARCSLHRIGYDHITGIHLFDPLKHAASGKPLETLKVVFADNVKQRLDDKADWTLLDVRKGKEVEASVITPSNHIFLGEIRDAFAEFDKDHPITVMCMSGKRATIGAGMLLSQGYRNVDVFMGSMGAWKATQES